MSDSRGFQLIHQPDLCSTISQTKLVDSTGSMLARVTYDSETGQFKCSCFVELPAHFMHKFISRSKYLLLPADPFRVRHDFTLMDERVRIASGILYPSGEDIDVRITDDLFSVLEDSLQWVPFWADISRPERTVIDQCGVCRIRHDGASVFAPLLEHWIGMFSTGPEELRFHRHATLPWTDNGTEQRIYYVEDVTPCAIILQRDEVIDMLTQLRDLCLQLLEKDGHYYIFHGGI